MFKLFRGLDRLAQVEKIALADIEARKASGQGVDEVEVRLAYRVGLKIRLELPNQPDSMIFSNQAKVTGSMLDVAYATIIARERTAQFVESLICWEPWMKYLQGRYQADFEKVSEPFHDRQNELDEQSLTMTSQAYRDEVEANERRRIHAIAAKAAALSQEIADSLVSGETEV